MTATTQTPPSRPPRSSRPPGYLRGPVIAVQPWPPLFVQAAWWTDPTTCHTPLAIVGEGGVLLAASVEALAHGVRAGQTLPQARLRCPALVALPPDRAVAAELWHQALSALLTLSPVVEAAPHDVAGNAIAYLDGRGLDLLWGDTRAVAHKAVQTLATQGLIARAGAGPSRTVAAALTRRMDAAGPRVLSPAQSRAFLAALALSDPLFALDDLTLEDLRSLGLTTAGELAALPHHDVATRFGPTVSAAWAIARGASEPSLRPWTPPARLSVQRPLDGAVEDRTIIDVALTDLCRELAACLRDTGQATELLTLQLTCDDAPPTLRCLHATAPLQGVIALTLAARSLWTQMQPPAPVVAVTLTAARLCSVTAQQEMLFDAGAETTKGGATKRAARLAQVLQAHRAQFGPGHIHRPQHEPTDPRGWTWSAQEP